jgi:hypothetical protein
VKSQHARSSDADAAHFARELLHDTKRLSAPHLFTDQRPQALYHRTDRQGIAVIALPTTALNHQELITIMRFRLAQYLAVGFVDAQQARDLEWDYEPLSGVAPQDVHLIAGSVVTGLILCYAVFRAPGSRASDATLHTRERVPFPVEESFGWGVFNHLPNVADMPLASVRELGRFVKNQVREGSEDLQIRAPVEIGVAVMHLLLTWAHRQEVRGVVGDIEDEGATRNLEFFRVPFILIDGPTAQVPDTAYLFARYHTRKIVPFFIDTSALSLSHVRRLRLIEEALDLPGQQALVALKRLKLDSV